jgi:hypothetical protein
MAVWAASKGKVAYWGFEGGVGAMFRDWSERKGGGERPKTVGEKPGGRESWFVWSWLLLLVWVEFERSPPGREKIEGREGDGWLWVGA